MQHAINHPHALAAIRLASFHQPDREHVARELEASGCPRRLYILARVLRTAEMMNELAEMDRKAALSARLDAINAAHPAVLCKTIKAPKYHLLHKAA